MERLFYILASVQTHATRSDDDFVDKLNYRYTAFLLCVFSMIVSAKTYVGDPITCWCPAEFKDNYEDFTNKYCWVHNTYQVPITQKHIPGDGEPKAYIGYYQWVPMFLLVQALMFYFPCMVWRNLNDKTGIDVNNIVQASRLLQQTAYVEQKEKTLKYITCNMDRYLKGTREYRHEGILSLFTHHLSRNFCLVCGSRRFGNYLVALYMVVKIFYLVNSIGQIFLLNSFLGTSYHMYGYQVLKRLFAGQEWSFSNTFPTVTLCDFNIRALNNIRQYTVQCVLTLNFFNEKMYIFIWFWMIMVASANILNTCTWFLRVLVPHDQMRYVKHHLRMVDKPGRIQWKTKQMRKRVSTFVKHYLKKDGVLVLRLVEINCDTFVVSELVAELFSHFQIVKSLPEVDTIDDRVLEEEI